MLLVLLLLFALGAHATVSPAQIRQLRADCRKQCGVTQSCVRTCWKSFFDKNRHVRAASPVRKTNIQAKQKPAFRVIPGGNPSHMKRSGSVIAATWSVFLLLGVLVVFY